MTHESITTPTIDDLENQLTSLTINDLETPASIPPIRKPDSPYTPSKPYFSLMTITYKDLMPTNDTTSTDDLVTSTYTISTPRLPAIFNIGTNYPTTTRDPRKHRHRQSKVKTPILPFPDFNFIQPKDGRPIIHFPRSSLSLRGTEVSSRSHEQRNKPHPYASSSNRKQSHLRAPLHVVTQDPPVHFKGNVLRPGTPYPDALRQRFF